MTVCDQFIVSSDKHEQGNLLQDSSQRYMMLKLDK